jgi:Flp pilus assembly protein TadD|tara:strand:+ start:1662 stop:3020 length:1359 start_codon:yes stop_codon:yes gene_type:complete
MIRQNFSKTLMLATALATLGLSGCAGGLGIGGSKTASANDAATARADGKTDKAITLAEQAVLAAPNDPAAKSELGSSYLAAGRFASAQQALEEALVLGDVSPRTALRYALASVALGDNRAAIETLGEWRDAIPPADLGLAYALAGNPELGAQVMQNALRAGENTPTMRQNLAYAYALGGNWAAARIIAAEDVAPGELDARISEWARVARPEDYTVRIANLLGVQPQADSGMPAQLALGGAPNVDQMLAQAAAATAVAGPVTGELPPVDLLASSGATRSLAPLDAAVGARDTVSTDFDSTFAKADVKTTATARPAPAASFVSTPVVQTAPAATRTASVAAPKPAAAPASAARDELGGGTHLVQLGSYASEADAKRGWAIFVKRHPQVANREQVITRAKVNGRIYYRLSAGNLAASSAQSLCRTVKAAGHGCIAWEQSRPLPGTLDAGGRVASR